MRRSFALGRRKPTSRATATRSGRLRSARDASRIAQAARVRAAAFPSGASGPGMLGPLAAWLGRASCEALDHSPLIEHAKSQVLRRPVSAGRLRRTANQGPPQTLKPYFRAIASTFANGVRPLSRRCGSASTLSIVRSKAVKMASTCLALPEGSSRLASSSASTLSGGKPARRTASSCSARRLAPWTLGSFPSAASLASCRFSAFPQIRSASRMNAVFVTDSLVALLPPQPAATIALRTTIEAVAVADLLRLIPNI